MYTWYDNVRDYINNLFSKGKYDDYCKQCGACGESGCCSAQMCTMHPKGKYCKGYLSELHFDSLLAHDLYKLCMDSDNINVSSEVDAIYDKNWDIVYEINDESKKD